MTGAHGETANQAQATISETGEIINHRRKIKPTHYEKTIFGDGSGTSRARAPTDTAHMPTPSLSPSAQSIHNVVQTPYGRLGSLNCWEQIQVRAPVRVCAAPRTAC